MTGIERLARSAPTFGKSVKVDWIGVLEAAHSAGHPPDQAIAASWCTYFDARLTLAAVVAVVFPTGVLATAGNRSLLRFRDNREQIMAIAEERDRFLEAVMSVTGQ
jgi:hypothetical protein